MNRPPGNGYPPQGYPQGQGQYPQGQPAQAQYPQAQYPQGQPPQAQYPQAPQAVSVEQALFAPRAVYPGAPHLANYPGPAPVSAEDADKVLNQAERKSRAALNVILAGGLFVVFGVICFITSAVFAADAGSVVTGAFPPTGGTVGPIAVTQPNTVLEIDFREPLSGYGWSYVSGEVSDDDDLTLFEFGGEMWHETGTDDDGRWDEAQTTGEIKVTVPETGNYFLTFTVEQQPGTPIGGNVGVTVRPKMGSSVPHFAAGLIGIIMGVLLIFVGMKMRPDTGDDDDDD